MLRLRRITGPEHVATTNERDTRHTDPSVADNDGAFFTAKQLRPPPYGRSRPMASHARNLHWQWRDGHYSQAGERTRAEHVVGAHYAGSSPPVTVG